jgi:hypothetical protein
VAGVTGDSSSWQGFLIGFEEAPLNSKDLLAVLALVLGLGVLVGVANISAQARDKTQN